jgi:hypothetical protein
MKTRLACPEFEEEKRTGEVEPLALWELSVELINYC